MRRHRIAAIPGDGIGKEVVPAGLEVLDALGRRSGFALDVETFPWGSDFYRATGRMRSSSARWAIRVSPTT
jgi:tartrate dehydrogenase/decarboxylase / D-malate dehydrogenase